MGNRTNMPSGWSSSAIGGACTFSRGVSWKKSQERRAPTAGAVPVLRIPNVQETLELTELLYIDGLTKAQIAKARVKRGWTLLVGSNGNPKRVGNCVYVAEPGDFLFASFLIRAKPTDPRRVDSEFLYRLLSWNPVQNDIWQSVQGSTGLSNIDLNSLKGLHVPIPPLPEQRKIATILSSVDDAIEKTQAVIDQVQVVKRGLMQELLTHGLPGRHTRFKRTEIGEIPREWDVCEISELCNRMFVGIAQAATHAYAERGVPIVRTKNVCENRLDVDNLLFITDEFAQEMKRKALCGGDVLTARTGYPGTSVVVPESLGGAQCFTLLVSRPGPRLRSRYLCHAMNSEHGSRIVSRGKAGGAQQNLNVSVFKKARLGVPSIEEQDAICDVLDACYSLEIREEGWKGALRALKDVLTSVLLTGELRVTPDTEAA